MSATGRNNVRHADDYYRTPAWCVRALLKYVKTTSEKDYAALHNSSILDPACGDAAILEVLDSYGFKGVGIEIDPTRAEKAREHGFGVYCGDALVTYMSAQAVITNPPYSLAMEFVQKALSRCDPPVFFAAFLLRLNWLASRKRAEFHRNTPADILVLPKRPSFTDDGKTDASEYAWFIWKRPFQPKGTWTIADLGDTDLT